MRSFTPKAEPAKPDEQSAPALVAALNIARVGDAEIRERLEEKLRVLDDVIDSITLSYVTAQRQRAEVERLLGVQPEKRSPKTLLAAVRAREAKKWRVEMVQRLIRMHGPMRVSQIHTLIIVACQPPSHRKAGTQQATLMCLRGNTDLFKNDPNDKTWSLL